MVIFVSEWNLRGIGGFENQFFFSPKAFCFHTVLDSFCTSAKQANVTFESQEKMC